MLNSQFSSKQGRDNAKYLSKKKGLCLAILSKASKVKLLLHQKPHDPRWHQML